MAKIVNISDKFKPKKIVPDSFNIKTIKASDVSVSFEASTDDISLFLKLSYKQMLYAREEIQRYMKQANAIQIDYWRTILKTFTSLNVKLIQIEEETYELTFAEFDCLVGALEVEIQEASIEELILVSTKDKQQIEHVRNIYNQLAPIYDKKLGEFNEQKVLS